MKTINIKNPKVFTCATIIISAEFYNETKVSLDLFKA